MRKEQTIEKGFWDAFNKWSLKMTYAIAYILLRGTRIHLTNSLKRGFPMASTDLLQMPLVTSQSLKVRPYC